MSSYIDHQSRELPHVVTHSWSEHTRTNLAWHYGEERAGRIHRGLDPKTQADLNAWRKLGRRDAA